MSQPSVASYFATRKRRNSEELRSKNKVLILDDKNHREVLPLIPEDQMAKNELVSANSVTKMETKKEAAVRNLQFELSSKSSKTNRTKVTRLKKNTVQEDNRQCDIRETLIKVNKTIEEDKNVVFEKLGCLSPKKSVNKRITRSSKAAIQQNEKIQEPAYCRTPTKNSSAYYRTPTKNSPAKIRDMTLDEIKSKITMSSRLSELRARIAKFKSCEEQLEKLEQIHKDKKAVMTNTEDKIKIKEFDRIELEIPVSPQKALLSPKKFYTPTKAVQLSPNASPARRLLFEPKEAPATPVTCSPSKAPAYQRYQYLVESSTALSLPYNYRFLAEIFRSIDTVVAMLYNRKEVITYNKLKPSVQELLRRNFTLDHLAQVKTVYPDAFEFRQEKMRSFGSMNPEKYELVITPIIESNDEVSGRNTPDEDNVLKSAMETNMGPSILLNRRKKFNSTLLEMVKDEHDKFLQSLEPPMMIPKHKITRWHPEFDVESCKPIDKAELPQPPTQDKMSTAKEVLEKANVMLNQNRRMKKAIEMLSDNQTKIDTEAESLDTMQNVEISIVDTPPATPKSLKPDISSMLKGIPPALLEKIRAKQAAKAMQMMTRSTDADKEAVMYARLPEIAKILRNIFVSEKKGVLPLESVVTKLGDSYRTKLTPTELEEHIRLICKLLPLWATIHFVRKIDYLKLVKNLEMVKIIERLEMLANEKAL